MLPVGLGKGMLNWSGKVRLGKVLLSCNNKYFHNVLRFSQGPLKFSCAVFMTVDFLKLLLVLYFVDKCLSPHYLISLMAYGCKLSAVNYFFA